MKKCPYCGFVIADDACHCPKCKAGIPHEGTKKNEEPEKVSKRRVRSERYGT